jgi:hypothetical protein
MSSLAAGLMAGADASAGHRIEQTKSHAAEPAAVNDAPLYLARARPFEEAG